MDVWSIPLSQAARPKTPRTTRRTRSPGGGGTSAKRARGSGYTATERSLFNALGTVGRSGAKREDVRSGTEIKVKGLFIRAKTLCAERRQSVHKRFPFDRHQTRERLIKPRTRKIAILPGFCPSPGSQPVPQRGAQVFAQADVFSDDVDDLLCPLFFGCCLLEQTHRPPHAQTSARSLVGHDNSDSRRYSCTDR